MKVGICPLREQIERLSPLSTFLIHVALIVLDSNSRERVGICILVSSPNISEVGISSLQSGPISLYCYFFHSISSIIGISHKTLSTTISKICLGILFSVNITEICFKIKYYLTKPVKNIIHTESICKTK